MGMGGAAWAKRMDWRNASVEQLLGGAGSRGAARLSVATAPLGSSSGVGAGKKNDGAAAAAGGGEGQQA